MAWWMILLVLLFGVPLLLLPIALIWYLNASGLYAVIREAQRRGAIRRRMASEVQTAENI